MIKALVFDIDNTLYDAEAAHEFAFAALSNYAYQELGIPPERFLAQHKKANDVLCARTREACAATHNRLIRYQLMLEQIGQPLIHAPKMAQIYWTSFLAIMKPWPDTQQTILTLRQQYPIGIGTNMTADYQYEKLERLGILSLIDFMVTSEEVNTEKPDGRFFELCVEKARCHGSECAFVGDSLENDILGAKQAGLHPIWFCPEAGTPTAEVACDRICSLSELPDLLRSL